MIRVALPDQFTSPFAMKIGGLVAGAVLLVATVSAAQTQIRAANGISASSAVAVVEVLHQALSANLRTGEALGFNARLARLTPVVAASFDFHTIARVAVGAAIDSLDAAQRMRLEHLLEDLSAAIYADRFFADDSKAQFVFVSQRPVRGARTLVRTRLERPGEASVALDYVLHDSGQGPRIVNVLADGVSDLSLKRAQYASIIRSAGVSALLERIELQLKQILQNRG